MSAESPLSLKYVKSVRIRGGAVVQWLALPFHNIKSPEFESIGQLGLGWVLFAYWGFHPQTTDKHVGLLIILNCL